ncbi:MAG: NAD(P)-binding domain-containing protein [Solirubrobacteraceae bacterium]
MTATATPDHQVAIVGAGPLGLAVAAHLRDARVSAFVCGRTMEFWRDQMPPGMMLRSPLRATSISSPRRELSLERWSSSESRPTPSPLPLEDFIAYGEWFQQRAAPDLDPRKASSIEDAGGSFRIALEGGEELRVQRVVVAGGIAPFPYIPPELRALPPTLVSHSSQYGDLGHFAGRRVVVLGGGQSAVETAALLREAGADVELIFREDRIVWLDAQAAWRLPQAWQPRIAFRCIRPAAAAWLHTRTDAVAMTAGETIVAAEPRGDQIHLALRSGAEREVDHLLLATGYEVDVRRYPFLTPGLLEKVQLIDGYPVLGPGLESSLPGLYFVGAPAARTFGPVMRFVTGSCYAAPAVARSFLGRRQPPLNWAF